MAGASTLDEHFDFRVTWTPSDLSLAIDGAVVRRVDQSPGCPMQLMVGVFDFPGSREGADIDAPALEVTRVTGHPLG